MYEIVAPIGAGGMGEVYRARDTRLDRIVALKILPPRFAGGGAMRERFERDARVVSSLNHPNICALYDVGRQDDVSFLVMEYLEGQSLADRLTKGPLPLDQALRYATDIADALAKAHAHGIVHRDLKPGNVMITRSGAKLLDFGLARRASDVIVSSHDAPTIQRNELTVEGTIVGTLQYMSPEQLESSDVDARSDIFAFGAVLYEMVTGRRAFEATSRASLITKIMSEQPQPVRALQPIAPLALERVIERCLRKDRDDRWQCAADLAAELRTISTTTDAAPEATPRTNRAGWIAAAALAILAAVLGAMLFQRPRVSEPTLRFSVPPPPDSYVNYTALWTPLAVSPDGNAVVLVTTSHGQRHLWLRRFGDAQATRLEGTTNAIAPFWSPDSKSVAFFADGKLKAIAVDGQALREICVVPPGGAFSGSWSANGTILFSNLTQAKSFAAVPASGGTPRSIAGPQGLFGVHYPHFLPDGKRFFFDGVKATTSSLWIGSLDGTAPKELVQDFPHVDYVPPYVVYARNGDVFAQRFDVDKLQLTGEPAKIASSVFVYKPLGTASHSAGGRMLAYAPPFSPKRAVWVSREGVEVDEAAPSARYHHMRLSPDGKRILTNILDPATGIAALWIIDTTRKTSTRASFGESDYDFPIWSPDGKQLVYSIDRDGPSHLYMKTIGEEADRELSPAGNVQRASDWVDGRIFFSENTTETRSDILTVSPTDRKISVWMKTKFNEYYPRVSPDRRWLAYFSDESGRTELYIVPLDRSSGSIRITNLGVSGAEQPVWRRDGRELFFMKGAREVWSVSIDANGDPGQPQRLFTAPADVGAFDVGVDGNRFLISYAEDDAAGISFVRNWQNEIERR